MFGAIKEKAKKVAAINQDKMLTEILSDDVLQAQIVDLNQKQLYEQGVQADGTETGQYHPYTVAYKIQYGDAKGVPGRVDHITGLNTGITYNSMKVKSLPEGIVVTADDRNNFFDREPKGLGLTNESLSEIRPHVREGLIEKVREAIK